MRLEVAQAALVGTASLQTVDFYSSGSYSPTSQSYRRHAGRGKLDTLHPVTDVVGRLPGLERSGDCLRGSECQLHRHDDDELFYLLDGEAMVQIGEDIALVGAGDLVMIPGGSVHTIWPAHAGKTFHAFSFAVNYVGECAVTNSLAADVGDYVRERTRR